VRGREPRKGVDDLVDRRRAYDDRERHQAEGRQRDPLEARA
jgi:hypothetical protein